MQHAFDRVPLADEDPLIDLRLFGLPAFSISLAARDIGNACDNCPNNGNNAVLTNADTAAFVDRLVAMTVAERRAPVRQQA